MNTPRPYVLILCTGSSYRSQIADSNLRHAAGDSTGRGVYQNPASYAAKAGACT
jgi:protein-tyrosine-phosphatase